MKIASRAQLLRGRKPKDEEYGRIDAFSNRHGSYTFDLPMATYKPKHQDAENVLARTLAASLTR